MRHLLAVCLSMAVIAAGAAHAAKKDDAFLIDKRDFKKQYKVVALAPVDAAPYLEMPESVAAMIEQEITARLQKEGFTVLPSAVLASIRKSMEQQVGGIMDPETGNANAAKANAVRDHAFRELWFREQFDALVTIRVGIYQVPVENDRVEWDGAKQKLVYEGRSKKYSATISVSSVSVSFYDSSNKPIYLYFGGLEPLMYRADEQLQPLSVDKFFMDEKRIRKAAQIAVDPI